MAERDEGRARVSATLVCSRGRDADAWIEEFARILRPGGVVAFTTRDVTFLDYCERLSRTQGVTGYSAALGALFPDAAVPRAGLGRGEFVFATSDGRFELVANRFDPARHDQRAYVLRRR